MSVLYSAIEVAHLLTHLEYTASILMKRNNKLFILFMNIPFKKVWRSLRLVLLTYCHPIVPVLCVWLIACPACCSLSFFINIDYNCPAPMKDFNAVTLAVTKDLFEGMVDSLGISVWMQAALCKASVWLNGSHVQSSAPSILLKGRIIDCIDQWSISVCMSLLLLWLHPQPVLGTLINAVTAQWRLFVYLFFLPFRWSVIDLLHIHRHLSLVKLAKAFV